MSKRLLTSNNSADLKATPTVRLTDKVGSRFVGRYVKSKTAKGIAIHEFQVVDGDALITIKENGIYRETDVQEGDTVALFGGKAINDAIAQVKSGEVVEFIFNEKKKLAGGRSFNDISVSIIDEVL